MVSVLALPPPPPALVLPVVPPPLLLFELLQAVTESAVTATATTAAMIERYRTTPPRCVVAPSAATPRHLFKPSTAAHSWFAEIGALRVEIVGEDIPGRASEPSHGRILDEVDDQDDVLRSAGYQSSWQS